MNRPSPVLAQVFGDQLEAKHAHLFCGAGGFAKGYNRSVGRLRSLHARMRCIGGIDVDAGAIADFTHASGIQGTVLDLFSREQYEAFHGERPPSGWREATPDDIRSAFGNEAPDVVALSAPCKGFSGLLAQKKSETEKYQALNQLAMRGLWLTLEAYKDNLPAIWTFENVPRIQSRGRHLLDQIVSMLKHYGYVVAETTHDCGEIGGLGQSRKRFLMVARLVEKVPNFLYEPPKRALRSVGDVLGAFPLPGDTERAGPMHRIPRLQWKTWVRLAFVPAGKDWRALNELAVENGFLRDFGLVPEYHHGYLGVQPWDRHIGAVTSRSGPSNGAFALQEPRVPDPRFQSGGDGYNQYGVKAWGDTAATVTGQRAPGQGAISVADIRAKEGRYNNVFRVVRLDETSPSITGGTGPSSGALALADPSPGHHPTYKQVKYRVCKFDEPSGTVAGASTAGMSAFALADPSVKWSPLAHRNKLKMTPYDAPAGTVTGSQGVQNGALLVADPKPNIERSKGDAYLHSRLFGIVPWTQHSFVISGKARHDNGPNNIADPRPPAATDKLVCYIRAQDGTWHRPFTTLELAALQSYVGPHEYLEMEGLSDTAWRERIGNLVPPDAAEAIGNEILRTLLMAHVGETFTLGSTPIWVRNVAIALSVAQPESIRE